MFPNGMMLVHTGLLARMQNEAQLAAVLGHEAGHYYRIHTLDRWRSIKSKTAVMSVIALGGAAASGSSGNGNWYDLASAINVGLLMSVFRYSRRHEREADAYGLRLLAEAGYSPFEASQVWRHLIGERQASAEARDKKYRDLSRSSFSTHPPSEDRMRDLGTGAQQLVDALFGARGGDLGADRWQAGVAGVRSELIEEQVKLNDPGASLYLLETLAQQGWTSDLKYFLGEVYSLRGEEGDDVLAADAYEEAVYLPSPMPEAWRAHGYALIKAGYREDGIAALTQYLQLRPDAPDAAMTRFTIGQ